MVTSVRVRIGRSCWSSFLLPALSVQVSGRKFLCLLVGLGHSALFCVGHPVRVGLQVEHRLLTQSITLAVVLIFHCVVEAVVLWEAGIVGYLCVCYFNNFPLLPGVFCGFVEVRNVLMSIPGSLGAVFCGSVSLRKSWIC